MKIDELIKELEKIKKEYGNLETRVQSMSHTWPPDPTVRGVVTKYVLLNP